MPNQNCIVHHEADNILNNAMKEVEELEKLSEALDRIICDAKQTISALESRCEKGVYSKVKKYGSSSRQMCHLC